jgi:hypothetical protein
MLRTIRGSCMHAKDVVMQVHSCMRLPYMRVESLTISWCYRVPGYSQVGWSSVEAPASLRSASVVVNWTPARDNVF